MAAPRPAKDIKPTDARTKLLKKMKQDKLRRDAKQFNKQAKAQAADKKVGKAKDVDLRKTRSSYRAKFLKDVKTGNIKAAPISSTAAASAESRLASTIKFGLGKAAVAAGFYFGDTFGDSTLNKGEAEFMAGIKKKAGKGYGSAPVGPFKPNKVASGSPFPKGKGTPNIPKSGGTSTVNTVRPEYPGSNKFKNKTGMPSVSMVRPEYPSNNKFKNKSSGGVNQFAIGEQNRQAKAQAASDKTKTGASAAPATKKSWFQRRQAERYAIGSSGKSL